jgi:hypothetical protein
VIAVFRYGKPQIDEPLADAYDRAILELKRITGESRDNWQETELAVLDGLRWILESESPDDSDDIKSKLSAQVRQMPDWLRYLCATNFSMNILGLETLSDDLLSRLRRAKSDRHFWPHLPQGILEPQRDYGEQNRFMEKMSLEELMAYTWILEKPEDEWTRHQHRFIEEMDARDASTHDSDHEIDQAD